MNDLYKTIFKNPLKLDVVMLDKFRKYSDENVPTENGL